MHTPNTPKLPACFASSRARSIDLLLAKVARYAHSHAPILICGEPGCGKEALSRYLHQSGPRQQHPFVTVECSAIADSNGAAELFGCERGAFSGGFAQREGCFQRAHQGILHLSEFGRLSLGLQARVRRALEDGEVWRVGSRDPERLDVQAIATMSLGPAMNSSEHEPLRDLLDVLGVLRLNIPPLRERLEDMQTLSMAFIREFQHEARRPIEGITDEALEALRSYQWPGNIRELRSVIRRCCIECEGSRISSSHLANLSAPQTAESSAQAIRLFDVEKAAILASLERHRGNKTAAAGELGVTPRTLMNKLRIYQAA